ncbi:unnamed protein product [Thelazia callipaeda]|uniref:Sepiapterin reductase n=1 Tax=Thelazia callipaeda TaxID=103827 RepID=A0A0N5CS59_THECL|nr:unnamed protein product [Thelazia callipaeda]
MTLIGRKVLAVITGASRGIGRETVLQLSKIVSEGSAFLITAKTATKLERLKNEVKSSTKGIDIYVLVCDAEKLNSGMISEFQEAVSTLTGNSRTFDALLLMHNAGTVGDVTKPGLEICSSDDWHNYLHINFVSAVLINNSVLRAVPKQAVSVRYILNVTSLLAVKAFPSLAQYSVGKAAREAFFRALAVEEPNLRILQYSPGPVQTDMHDELAQKSYDKDIRKTLQTQSMSSEIKMRTLSPSETVKKMLEILDKDEFENGSRCDFFDS